NVMHLEIGRLCWKGDDGHVDGTVFDALQNLVAEIEVDADVHERKALLKLREDIGEKIKAGGFVCAEQDRALHDVAAIGDDLDGLVAQAEKPLGKFEKDFTGR